MAREVSKKKAKKAKKANKATKAVKKAAKKAAPMMGSRKKASQKIGSREKAAQKRKVRDRPEPTAFQDIGMDPIDRLTRDIRDSARLMSANQARFLVDAYYIAQKDRIRSDHQVRTLEANNEPSSIIDWLGDQTRRLEESIRGALDAYSLSRVDGQWLRSITGIGPVIAAGMMAHIDIEQAPTVGHIWRFAGLDPTNKWKEKTKRPWNGALKRLCWILGESFTKVSSNESDVYGNYYMERKALEIMRNDRGMFADQAAVSLEEKKFHDDTDAKRWYQGEYPGGTSAKILPMTIAQRESHLKKVRVEPGKGVAMLPPARIHLRAQRWAVKLLLAHYHHVLYESANGKPPPKPYIIETNANHTHIKSPPNWPMQ